MSEEIVRRKRRPGLLLPLLIGVPVLFLLFVFFLRMDPEPLSPDEILAKKQWNDQELTQALARSMSLTMTGQHKRKIQRHLSKELKKRPQDVRERIRCQAVAETVTTSLKQLRQMPTEDRDKMIQSMQKKAEKNYATLVSSSAERKKLAEQMKTQEMKAFTDAVNKVVFSEFTPTERVQFAPITKIWIKTMKVMGK
jgi:hypothetical protein